MKRRHQRIAQMGMWAGSDQCGGPALRHFQREARSAQDACRQPGRNPGLDFVGKEAFLARFGAVAGTLLSTFYLLEHFGNRRTLFIAALLNLLIALAALLYSNVLRAPQGQELTLGDEIEEDEARAGHVHGFDLTQALRGLFDDGLPTDFDAAAWSDVRPRRDAR